jgi:hypothetical protein
VNGYRKEGGRKRKKVKAKEKKGDSAKIKMHRLKLMDSKKVQSQRTEGR